jgi:hypothetical protein
MKSWVWLELREFSEKEVPGAFRTSRKAKVAGAFRNSDAREANLRLPTSEIVSFRVCDTLRPVIISPGIINAFQAGEYSWT